MLNRAAATGVHALLTVGVDVPSSMRAVALARRFGPSYGVVAAVGLHPAFLAAPTTTSATEAIAHIGQIVEAAPEQVVAVGEIGLDTIDGRAALDVQADVFRTQLRLAHRCGLPVVLHIRGARAIALAQQILATEGIGTGTVVHYFTGSLAEAQQWLDLGCDISVGRPVTRTVAAALRAAIASPSIPLERLLIETDTYPLPGRRTEPADVVSVATAIAVLKQLSLGEVAHQTTAHFHRLFG